MRFFGHVDGVIDGEIYGWAYDVENPLDSLPLSVFVNQRQVAEVVAFYYRPDVAERMNCSGQHGFYFDLTAFVSRATNAIIDVRFPDGTLLSGTPLRSHLPARNGSSSSTLLFMHIPKTAGTALREAAVLNYRQSQVGYIYEHPPGLPLHALPKLPPEQRAHLRFVVGHFGYGVHRYIPRECRYFTVIRDPLSRVWSHYNHLIQEKNPAAVTPDGRIRTLEEMLAGKITIELDNLTVRYLAGIDPSEVPVGAVDRHAYDLAVAHLEKAILCVGFPERLDQAYDFLRNRLGWTRPPSLDVMNPGSYPVKKRPSAEDEALMRRFNQWDISFYEYVCSRKSLS